MEEGAEQVAARSAADQEYRRRRRSDVAVLLFPYGTDGFYLDISSTARQSRSLLQNTTAAGDWCSATAGPEHRAVRLEAVPAVRCRRLCENWTAVV